MTYVADNRLVAQGERKALSLMVMITTTMSMNDEDDAGDNDGDDDGNDDGGNDGNDGNDGGDDGNDGDDDGGGGDDGDNHNGGNDETKMTRRQRRRQR